VGREWDVLYEVQLRLAAPDGRHISPAELLPVAERHGLIPAIDRWVLDHALDVLDTEREQRPGLRLLVHQTLETAAAPDWLDWFRDRVAGRNLIRQRPLLELQIGELRRRPDLARPLLQGLRRLGIQVCAANCTGAPEDLTLLASLGVSLAKLAFKTLNDSTEGGLAEILKQLRGQGVATIAAGIEDPDTVARVWACGPDYIQGHFLQMPCSEPVFEVAKGEAD
jgi:EAL domain-containing protein (putative c-di-GMP-specific phosphodiesterase class I)